MSQYKRQEVMTGPLPEDFLRLGPSSNTTTVLATPGAGGMVAYSSENRNGTVSQTVAYAGPSSGVLSVTVAQVSSEYVPCYRRHQRHMELRHLRW
jgi:hypothetical protein